MILSYIFFWQVTDAYIVFSVYFCRSYSLLPSNSFFFFLAYGICVFAQYMNIDQLRSGADVFHSVPFLTEFLEPS